MSAYDSKSDTFLPLLAIHGPPHLPPTKQLDCLLKSAPPRATNTMASQTPTSASNRLLNMKFMQRAAAAGPPASPVVPPTDDSERSSKRRKTSGRAKLGGAPETPTYVIDHTAAKAALEEEERKRQVLVAKHAEALGDSHWILDAAKLPGSQQGGAPLKIVQVGFSQIDRGARAEEEEEEDEETATIDGPTFRSFGPKKEAPAKDDASSRTSNQPEESANLRATER